MVTKLVVLRSDLVELRLKLLGGSGDTLLDRARSLEATLGPRCLKCIRSVDETRKRHADGSATQPLGRAGLTLFLEDCEVVDRHLVGLLNRANQRMGAIASAVRITA
jgi:hypothetical protein